MKKKLCIGILAHVDAGKTTLSEAMLYTCGSIRTLGRVDHQNTYLDSNRMERERGITIFSKLARFSYKDTDFVLLDTPGHVDFSAETERTLSLLDYAILVISAGEGVQSHTRTLWQLLTHYGVPTFIFVNKTDISGQSTEETEADLQKHLCGGCISINCENRDEKLALLNETFLESFLSEEPIDDTMIAEAIAERTLFPCFFGSALRLKGIDDLLLALDRYTLCPEYSSSHFAARVYKIQRVGSTRLTFMKLTGGGLNVRDELTYKGEDGREYKEKIAQIRLYSGEKYTQVDSAKAGEICAVIGLSASYAGLGMGAEQNSSTPLLEPVLSYCIRLPIGCDPVLYFPKLKQLEEEEPSLHLYFNEEHSQIEARLMGEIQMDLLASLVKERFGIDCTFDAGKILYKEKAASKAVGIGHFEPLRHYAEVQVLIEPQPSGSGLVIDNRLAAYDLDINWQRLILSHLYGEDLRGVRICAPLTDTKITLIAGKAHLKHTEGGDFREATLRAVRQGLMRAGCELLEPYYRFCLELPSVSVGRAMADLQSKHAEFRIESTDPERSVIIGNAPVSTLHDYQKEVLSYTKGEGKLSFLSLSYEKCHNEEQIVSQIGYDPTADLLRPCHSVFCAGGAGFTVPWDEVEQHKHLDAGIDPRASEEVILSVRHLAKKYSLSDEDLEAIMLREFGPIKRRRYSEPKSVSVGNTEKPRKKPLPQQHLLIIDGYNVIYAWEHLAEIAAYDLAKARDLLMDTLSNYVGFTKTEVLLVFDAYLVDGMGSQFTRDGYTVVFTKEDETADSYIEKQMSKLGPNYNIRLVTADRLLQFSAVHSGISRMTPMEFEDEIIRVGNEIREFVKKLSQNENIT